MAEREQIAEWSARRSGAALTLTGKDKDGEPVRIPNIASIEVKDGAVIATDPGANVVGEDPQPREFELVVSLA